MKIDESYRSVSRKVKNKIIVIWNETIVGNKWTYKYTKSTEQTNEKEVANFVEISYEEKAENDQTNMDKYLNNKKDILL